MLEGCLQGPAMPIELCSPFGRYLARQVRQDGEPRSPVAGRLLQFEPQAPPDVLGAVLSHHTHALLGDGTRRRAIVRLPGTSHLKGHALMLAHHAAAPTRVHLT